MTLRSILLLPLVAGTLAGCGLKGPLYLPEHPEQKVSEQTDEQQRKERTRDAGAQTPAGASTASESPPGN